MFCSFAMSLLHTRVINWDPKLNQPPFSSLTLQFSDNLASGDMQRNDNVHIFSLGLNTAIQQLATEPAFWKHRV